MQLLEERIGKEEMEKRITEKQEKFAGLLTREGAIQLVAREEGILKEEESKPMQFKKLSELKQGEEANFIARVMHVNSAKEFEKAERKGRVRNVELKDETKAALLVLWNKDTELVDKIQRGEIIEVKRGWVKSLNPLEIHSQLVTEIKPFSGEEKQIPKHEKQVVKVRELKEGVSECDFFARIIEVGEEREFEREGKKGKLARIMLADETGSVSLVLWDKNAELVRRARQGDSLKVESAYCKLDRNGKVEAHLGWKGRAILNPKISGELKEREELMKEALEAKKLSEFKDGEEALVEAVVSKTFEARLLERCKKCYSKWGGGKCACGSTESKKVAMASVEVMDETSRKRCVFYDKNALELLGTHALGETDLETLMELRKSQVVGKKIDLTARAKKNDFSGEVELIAKKIIDLGKS